MDTVATARGFVSFRSGLMRLADMVADQAGILRRPLRMDDLILRAQREAGCSDFGDSGFQEPLRRLLGALSAPEADLSLVGRFATRWDIVRFLGNLLRLQAEEERQPRIAEQRIRRPIFITGLPRSGTTFLHRLMMTDRANRAPLVWETISPGPTRWEQGDNVRSSRRVERVAKQLKAFEWLAPEFRACIRWTRPRPRNAARSPRTCSAACVSIPTIHCRPTGGGSTLTRGGICRPISFTRRFLRHLQYQDPGTGCAAERWVLKCPEHVFALRAIRAVYPDARLIFVHRDPVKVLLSVAH